MWGTRACLVWDIPGMGGGSVVAPGSAAAAWTPNERIPIRNVDLVGSGAVMVD